MTTFDDFGNPEPDAHDLMLEEEESAHPLPAGTDDLSELDRKALAATPGPWEQSHRERNDGYWTQVYTPDGETIASLHWYPKPPNEKGGIGTYREGNAAFIAAANPSVVLDLISRLRQAQQSLSEKGRKGVAWQGMDSAPLGCVTDEVGVRGESRWFIGRVAERYKAGRPPYIIVRRRSWPHEDSWACAGEAHYTGDFFDAWSDLYAAPSPDLQGEVKRLREALARQTDNMAFVLNHAEVGYWYDQLSTELKQDREALHPSNKGEG